MEQNLVRLFLDVLSMSVTASYVIAAVLALRLLLRRAPKIYSYALWSVAGFRLVCPVSFSSALSLFNLKLGRGEVARVDLTEVPGNVYSAIQPEAAVGVQSVNAAINAAIPDPTPMASMNPAQFWLFVGAVIWVAVAALLLLRGAVSYVRLKGRLETAVKVEDGVFRSERVDSPFILGLVRPKIYIPCGLEGEGLAYVLLHERTHLRRWDHRVKAAAWLLLVLHWFNPLVWLAFRLMVRDMEMSCDEAVLSRRENIRKAYGATLLRLAAGGRLPSPSPLAFGESDVKERIKNVLNWNKPKVWLSAAALIACAVMICACATDPQTPEVPPVQVPTQLPEAIVEQETPVEEVDEATLPATPPAEPTVDDTLKLPEDAIILGQLPGNISLVQQLHHAILEHHRTEYSEAYFCCANYVVLANEAGTRMHPVTGGELATMNYFLMVLYQEYEITPEGIEHMDGAHVPTNITLTEEPDGSWSVLNYWEPRDGSYYADDIRAVFPGDSADDALDNRKYIMAQMQDCYAQAVEWAKVSANAEMDVDAVIEGLLDEICSSPLESSNPKDYAAEHSVEYRELVYYGRYTRDYCERHLAALEDIKSYPANVDLRARVMELLLEELDS